MMLRALFLAAAVPAAATAAAAAAAAAPERLRVEYMENPTGVDVTYPLRFSWALGPHPQRGEAQSAYQIVVTTADLKAATVWDSGKVASNVSQNVPIGVKSLTADTPYKWTVKTWDRAGVVSAATTATFSTGLYTKDDWKGAQWIGGAGGQYRKEFSAKGPVARATAYIVGLGYFKLHVSGKKVSDHELGAFTTYEERVYYSTIDCTEAVNAQVVSGSKAQAVGVHLGDGWYAQHSVHVGKPELLMRLSLHYLDGTTEDVISDTSWKFEAGPVTSVDIYNGENYNASLETPGWTSPGFADAGWTAAAVSPPPSDHVKLTSHAILPPIRIAEDYTPMQMWQSAPDTYVYDFGQNMAGFVTLYIPEGIAVTAVDISMLHAEAIHGPPENHSSVFHHYRNAKETNVYTTKGDGAAASYTPLFTYAGFRYMQLTGYPGTPDFKTLTAHFVHTDYELTGAISFSDPMLDAVQHITRTAAMSNFQSIPTDCPQRERRGWLGDAQLSAETNMHNFDMAAPYTSFVQQINDQQTPTGAVGDCVPYYGHGRIPADPAWGTAYTFLADWVGKYYHDNQIFEEHYSGITAHLNELINASKDDGGMDGLLSYSGWGDWCPPSGCHACWPGTPKTHNSVIVSSFYYISQLRIVSRYAGILGHTEDQKKYADLAAAVTDQFNKHFFNAANATYEEPGRQCGEYLGVQATISLAYELGVIPPEHEEAVINTLVDDIARHDWHLNVGIVGIKYLLPTLSKAGRGDVALMIAQARTPPSYIYMVEQGATTLWETWTGSTYSPVASWNHIMFGSNSDWYFKYLAGLQQDPDSRGWQQLELHPQVWNNVRNVSICANLSSTEASILTPRGLLSGSWTCGGAGPSVSSGLCGMAPEKSTVELSCKSLGGGTIKSIAFASFGTPGGSCAAGFVKNTKCDEAGALAKVQKLCVGKPSCSLPATTEFFGGDPCFDTVKRLAVSASGCAQQPPGPPKNKKVVFTYDVTVPVGSTASVYLPKMGSSDVLIMEKEGTVFANDKYVTGVSGVVGAEASGHEISVSVGSGAYAFEVLS
jgi:alpha-L-rhamnosidase